MLNNIPINYVGVCDVELNFQTYFKLLTNKVMRLFKFENLPSTVDERFLKEQLVLRGRVCFTTFNGEVYALNGSIGGKPNVYYEPTEFIIANPILGSKTVKVRNDDGSESIDQLEGVLVCLTPLDQDLQSHINGGLYGLIYQTAGLLADNISSLNCAQINGRATVSYTAESEAEANSAEEVLKEIYAGKPFKVLKSDIMEKINATPLGQSGNNSTLMTLIEAHQYILAQFFNEIGIAGNWNMKRERVNTAETELMTGSLGVNIKVMEDSIKKDIERVNQLLGTDIKFSIDEEVIDEVIDDTIDEEPTDNVVNDTVTEEEEEPPKDGTVVTEEEEVKKENKDGGED